MNYIYDIYLNFQKNLYEFYDWNTCDKIIHIKKIPMIKISTKSLKDIINNNVLINYDSLDIKYKCLYYQGKGISKYKNAILLTDGVFAIAINTINNYNYKSRLLLFEEEEVLRIAKKTNIENIDYKIISKINNNNFLTRNQYEKYIEINNYIDKNQNHELLKYLYYEICNEKEEDIDKIIKKIRYKLDNNFNEIENKINDLYKIIK